MPHSQQLRIVIRLQQNGLAAENSRPHLIGDVTQVGGDSDLFAIGKRKTITDAIYTIMRSGKGIHLNSLYLKGGIGYLVDCRICGEMTVRDYVFQNRSGGENLRACFFDEIQKPVYVVGVLMRYQNGIQIAIVIADCGDTAANSAAGYARIYQNRGAAAA